MKLVAENLRYGSLTKRFVTIGGVAFLAFNPMIAGKVAEVFGVRELQKWYLTAFWGGMGGLAIGAVGAAIVEVNYLIREVLLPESHSILSQGKLYHLFSYSFFAHQHPMHPIV